MNKYALMMLLLLLAGCKPKEATSERPSPDARKSKAVWANVTCGSERFDGALLGFVEWHYSSGATEVDFLHGGKRHWVRSSHVHIEYLDKAPASADGGEARE